MMIATIHACAINQCNTMSTLGNTDAISVQPHSAGSMPISMIEGMLPHCNFMTSAIVSFMAMAKQSCCLLHHCLNSGTRLCVGRIREQRNMYVALHVIRRMYASICTPILHTWLCSYVLRMSNV